MPPEWNEPPPATQPPPAPDAPRRRQFAVRLTTEEVEVDGAVFTLSELTMPDKQAVTRDHQRRFRFSPEGKVLGLKDGVPGTFAADLLTRAMTDANHRPVTARLLDGWPSTVVDDLYDIAARLSRMGRHQPKDDDAGNG